MIRLSGIQVFMGANIHCGFPAVAGRVEMAPGAPALSIEWVAALQADLIKMLPGLATTEFLPVPDVARLASDLPAALAATLAWLSAQLQNLGNACVAGAATARAGNRDLLALSAYQVPEVGVQAMQLACAMIAAACEPAVAGRPAGAALRGWRRDFANFLPFAQAWHLDVQTQSIVSAARARDIPHYRICSSARFVQLGQGVHQQHIYETVSDRTPETGAKIAHNKVATHHLLRSLGLPTAEQVPVTTFEQAAAAAARLGYPVVVKPSHGLQARGVTVDVRDPQELKAACQLTAEVRLGGILVEKFVPGDHHRLTVIDGKLVTAVRWIPAHVVGDGVHTVGELIAIANRNDDRGEAAGYEFDFGKKRVRMAPNPEMSRMLAARGYGHSSVPARDEIVRLHGTTTLASGGDGIDVTQQVHPDVREMAELVARAYKLDAVGVDYLSADISRSYRDGGAICEVNACPGFQGHLLIGVDRELLLGALLQRHFRGGQTGRVPTVAIAGGAGAATVARMVAHLLEMSGRTTALAFSGGVMVGAQRVRAENCAGGEPARAVMMDPRVEAVVLELSCANLLAAGMPIDSCDVGVVLDAPDELAVVKALVPKTASRCAVLNADDARCLAIGAQLQAPICWVAANPHSPVPKNRDGTSAMSVTLTGTGADAQIVVMSPAQRLSLARIGDVPVTMESSTRLTEILSAAAIARALDVPCEQIRSGLTSLRHDFSRD